MQVARKRAACFHPASFSAAEPDSQTDREVPKRTLSDYFGRVRRDGRTQQLLRCDVIDCELAICKAYEND